MIEPLGYHPMRMRWCAAAMLAFVRRCSAYLAVGAMVVGAGASAGVDAVRAVAAWSVLPLFRSVADGRWFVVAIALQAIAGAMLVRGMWPLLWPTSWLFAERALPIPRGDTVRSDLVVLAFALSPLCLLYALGAETLIERHLDWLHPVQGRALVALATAVAGSLALGLAILQLARCRGVGRPWLATQAAAFASTWRRSSTTPSSVGLRWQGALLRLPLWRGPARRTGRALGLGFAALAAPCLVMARQPFVASWCLAAYAVLAMWVTSRTRALAVDDLHTLGLASRSLPISPASIEFGIDLVVLSPLLLSAPLLFACLPWSNVRPIVLTLFAVCGLASCFAEAQSRSADAVAASSRWLFCVALSVALASEVTA